MVMMFTMIMIMVVFMRSLSFTLFFWCQYMIMKLWNLMKHWLNEGLPDFFLLNKAFNLNLIINIILDITGNSSLDDYLNFPFGNDESGIPYISLEYNGLIGYA